MGSRFEVDGVLPPFNRWRKPRPEGSQAWRTFLQNHLNGIWAADLFEFIDYYNNDRPHRSLALTSPVPIRPSREGR
jgi:transposase InsO family protein